MLHSGWISTKRSWHLSWQLCWVLLPRRTACLCSLCICLTRAWLGGAAQFLQRRHALSTRLCMPMSVPLCHCAAVCARVFEA